MSRINEARETLLLAERYMDELGRGIDTLSKIALSDRKAEELMESFFPVTLDMPEAQRKNNLRLLDGVVRS